MDLPVLLAWTLGISVIVKEARESTVKTATRKLMFLLDIVLH